MDQESHRSSSSFKFTGVSVGNVLLWQRWGHAQHNGCPLCKNPTAAWHWRISILRSTWLAAPHTLKSQLWVYGWVDRMWSVLIQVRPHHREGLAMLGRHFNESHPTRSWEYTCGRTCQRHAFSQPLGQLRESGRKDWKGSLSLATWTGLLQGDRLSWKDQSSRARLMASTDIDTASNYNRANGELSVPGPLLPRPVINTASSS